jgi:hypothetical protein
MKYYTMKALGAAALLCTVYGGTYAQSVTNEESLPEGGGAFDPVSTPDNQSDGQIDTVTPETFRQQLRSINTQRRKVNAAETTGAIPQLPEEVPPGEDEDMWRLRRASMHYFKGEMEFRYKDGEEGLDQLFAVTAPLEFNFNTGYGRIDIEAESVFLSAGDLSGNQFTNRYYGTLALEDPALRPTDISDDDGGVGLSIGYDVGGFELNLGTTPLGFEITNAIGDISFDHSFSGGFNFGLGVSREAVKESVLSYAGLKDPVTKQEWGGIVKNAANLGLGFDAGNFGVYADGTVAVYEGDEVEDNNFYQVNTGMYFHPYRGDKLQISSGFNITYFSFEENLRYFTFGHGGYFSPESFYSATIPLRITYSEGKMTLKTDMGFGMQYFDEDSAPFYPSDPDLQASLEATGTDQPVEYESNTETEFAVRIGAEVSYQLSVPLSARGAVEYSHSADYDEAKFLVGMEYRFGKGY